jgi:hypothetical protein
LGERARDTEPGCERQRRTDEAFHRFLPWIPVRHAIRKYRRTRLSAEAILQMKTGLVATCSQAAPLTADDQP